MTTSATSSIGSLGLRAQLAAAAHNELGTYLARNDQVDGGQHIDRSAAHKALLRRIADENYAAIDAQILRALRLNGELLVPVIAAKIGRHYTCALTHLNRLVASGRVSKRLVNARIGGYRIAPSEDQK